MANHSSLKIVEMFAGVVELKRPPKLERIKNRERIYWRVILGKRANGQLVRKTLPVKDDETAQALFGEICSRLESGEFDSAVGCFETHADHEFQAVRKKLSPYAVTVTQAVEFYLQHHRPNKGIITLKEALQIWEEHSEREGNSLVTIRKMKDSYAGPFAKVYGHLRLQDLNYEVADDYVFKHKKDLSANSKAETIQKLRGFLNKLARIGYYSRELNPFEKLIPPKERHDRDQEKDRLIPPEMMRELLEFALASEKPGFREMGVAIILEAFCGIRRTEVERLERKRSLVGLAEINTEVDPYETPPPEPVGITVAIPELHAKLGHKRNFEMPENAVVWLRYFVAQGWKLEGPFFTKEATGESLSSHGINVRRRRFLKEFKEFCEREKMEFPNYLQNGFRVSCASYGAKFFGVAEICAMLGHTRPATFWKHYREDCSASDAKRYFSLIPRAEDAKRNAVEAEELAVQQAMLENPPEID